MWILKNKFVSLVVFLCFSLLFVSVLIYVPVYCNSCVRGMQIRNVCCASGPRGLPGEKGESGEPGKDGQDGQDRVSHIQCPEGRVGRILYGLFYFSGGTDVTCLSIFKLSYSGSLLPDWEIVDCEAVSGPDS